MAKEKITMRVDRHSSGRRTLKERIGSTGLFEDCKGSLWGNPNAAEFYRAVAKRIASKAKQYEIAYEDDSEPQMRTLPGGEEYLSFPQRALFDKLGIRT